MALLLSVGIFFETLLSLWQLINQGSIGGLFYFFGERTFTASTPGIANASINGELILRPYATFSHPNMLAGYLLVAMLLTAYLSPYQKALSKLAVFFSFLIGTIGLAISLSRTEIIAWLLIGISAIIKTFRERISKSVLFLFLGVLSSWVVVIAFFPWTLSRMLSLSFGQSLTERVLLAKYALKLIMENPIFGVGPGNFIPSLPFLRVSNIILQPVHSIYLLTAVELGIPGFIIFVLFLAGIGGKLLMHWQRVSIERKNATLLLGFAYFTILFSGFFDHYFLTLQQGQLLFALTVGLIFQEVRQNSVTIQK